MLKGEAKRLYQREYMRRRRSNIVLLDPAVRPSGVLDPSTSGAVLDPVRPSTGSVRPVLDPVRPFTPVPKPGKRMVQSEG